MAWPFFNLFSAIVNIFLFILLINIVLSWLINFDVVDRRNQFIQQIYRATGALTEPVLAPLRRVLPSLGGMDLSPIVLGLGLYFVRDMLFLVLRSAGLL
jgi:YggT family protein